MDKVVDSAHAVADTADSPTIAVGRFGVYGAPCALLTALCELGSRELEMYSNSCRLDGEGLDLLLDASRIRRLTSSEGEIKEFAHQYLTGALEVELTPQGNARPTIARGWRWYPRVLHAGRRGHTCRLRRASAAPQGRRPGLVVDQRGAPIR